MSGRYTTRTDLTLEAAAYLVSGGFPAQAVSRAYYGAFYAAEAALAAMGETRSRHSGVVAAFGQLLVLSGAVEPDAGRKLRSLFDRRTGADYGDPDEARSADALRAVADATDVVDAVERWLRSR